MPDGFLTRRSLTEGRHPVASLNARAVAKRMRKVSVVLGWGARVPVELSFPASLVSAIPYSGPFPFRDGWNLYVHQNPFPATGEVSLSVPNGDGYLIGSWLRNEQGPSDDFVMEKPSEAEVRAFDSYFEWSYAVVNGSGFPADAVPHPLLQLLWREPGSKWAYAEMKSDTVAVRLHPKVGSAQYEAAWLRRMVALANKNGVPMRLRMGRLYG